jgi:hypothetical protein
MFNAYMDRPKAGSSYGSSTLDFVTKPSPNRHVIPTELLFTLIFAALYDAFVGCGIFVCETTPIEKVYMWSNRDAVKAD